MNLSIQSDAIVKQQSVLSIA